MNEEEYINYLKDNKCLKITETTIKEKDHSIYSVKFYSMQKQIDERDEEIQRLNNQLQQKEKENEILKHRLNDIVFGDDYELGARYLRKIGYIDFDEERKVYINKHNKEPFWHKEEKEKDYYIKDEELDEYTKQLEFKLQQKENIIKGVREKIESVRIFGLRSGKTLIGTLLNDILEILDKENKE